MGKNNRTFIQNILSSAYMTIFPWIDKFQLQFTETDENKINHFLHKWDNRIRMITENLPARADVQLCALRRQAGTGSRYSSSNLLLDSFLRIKSQYFNKSINLNNKRTNTYMVDSNMNHDFQIQLRTVRTRFDTVFWFDLRQHTIATITQAMFL